MGRRRSDRRDNSPDRQCARLAAGQFGLVSGLQARLSGLSYDGIHDRVRTGRWERLLPGVFRIAGAQTSWHQRLMAACLWLPQGAISHRAAARLWELEGCKEHVVEISAGRDARTSADWLILHRSQLDRVDRANQGPFIVTTPTRTLIDLCSVLPRDRVDVALDDALRRGLTSLPRLRWASRRMRQRGRRGIGVFQELLKERGRGYVPSESPLEATLRRVLATSGLPRPVPQHEVRDRGRLIARMDLAYPGPKVAIEADGYRYHSGKTNWQRDLRRRNALGSRGWIVLHVTWDDLRSRPDELIDTVRRVIDWRSSGEISSD